MEEAAFLPAPLPPTVLTNGAVCVGTEGNIGWWNGEGWTDFGRPGGWTLDWLIFT